MALPYWNREYVGLGPYRLERWEPGAFIEGVAFDRYALGRPKIDRVRLIPVTDHNAALTNLFADAAHITVDNSLNFPQLRVLQREWGPRNAGAVLLTADNLRYTQFQLKPEIANPRAILDVRVRRALAHTVDKEALNEGLLEGQSSGADSFISPQQDFFATVDAAIAKYPLDPRRADQLLAEAGFNQGTRWLLRECERGAPVAGATGE